MQDNSPELNNFPGVFRLLESYIIEKQSQKELKVPTTAAKTGRRHKENARDRGRLHSPWDNMRDTRRDTSV